jgi:hypothetical protein
MRERDGEVTPGLTCVNRFCRFGVMLKMGGFPASLRNFAMKRVIHGRSYNTETATEICEVPCKHYHGDFQWHETRLYSTKNGNFFISGKGGPMSLWAMPAHGGAMTEGEGIRPLSVEEARRFAEAAELSPKDIQAAGLTLTEV